MKKFLLLFSIACNFLYAFYDEELEEVWSSITDINHPTIEDYKRIEDYLKNGKRPYLDDLRNSPLSSLSGYSRRLSITKNLKLIGSNGELPVFEVHHVDEDENSRNRCILLYATYNGIYPDKVRTILSELKSCGYRGHVLVRIGGFPNVSNGGLKLAHIPYSWKVAFFKEAQLLGYKEILWLDSSLHPLANLEKIFTRIKERGCFFTTIGSLNSSPDNLTTIATKSLNIAPEQYDHIPHIIAAILGLDMENDQAIQYLENWYHETEKVFPNITWFNDELSLSVTAWRYDCKPISWFGEYVCLENELLQLQERNMIHFYMDSAR